MLKVGGTSNNVISHLVIRMLMPENIYFGWVAVLYVLVERKEICFNLAMDENIWKYIYKANKS